MLPWEKNVENKENLFTTDGLREELSLKFERLSIKSESNKKVKLGDKHP
jgi:hypothetical protein